MRPAALLHLPGETEMQRRVTFWALALVPTLGLFVNTIFPPEKYGYIQEQALLIIWALVAVGLVRVTVNGATIFYCSFALVPVGMMLKHYGDFSPLVFVPLLGVALVTLLTRNERAIVMYGPVALISSVIFGVLVDDLGLGGALAFLSGALTACALWWTQAYNLKAQLMEIGDRQENIDRGLNRITGELGK